MKLNATPSLIALDNIYPNPDEVREYALSAEYFPEKTSGSFRFGNAPWPGKMTKKPYINNSIDKIVSSIIGKPVRQLLGNDSGKFRISKASDTTNNVVHSDSFQQDDDVSGWAGVVYLCPKNANGKVGTSLFTHVESGATSATKEQDSFISDWNDASKWYPNLVSHIVWNRLILYPANKFHGIGPLFGETDEDARLVQLFTWSTVK